MRKQVFGRHLKRDTHERKALFRGLASSLVLEERIRTTEAKAKSIKSLVDKLVTKAKNNTGVHAEGLVQPYLSPLASKKLLEDIAPRFANRPGGYTRIIKIGQRFNDNADMVIMEWVEKPIIKALTLSEKKKTTKKDDKKAVESTVKVKTEDKTKTKQAKSKVTKGKKSTITKKSTTKREEV